MEALDEFDVTLTLCFTPEHLGIERHYTSPPVRPQDFADFASRMVSRYAPTLNADSVTREAPVNGWAMEARQ